MWRKTNAVASWSWDGCEGKKTKIIVYANAAFVELRLNGKSLGVTGKDLPEEVLHLDSR